MVFVPCRDGISHSVLEHVEPEHMTLGTRVLAGATALLLADAQG
jgi:acetylornithine deacetylase/succinyl-diaminopimelate desuccinylase-like protein